MAKEHLIHGKKSVNYVEVIFQESRGGSPHPTTVSLPIAEQQQVWMSRGAETLSTTLRILTITTLQDIERIDAGMESCRMLGNKTRKHNKMDKSLLEKIIHSNQPFRIETASGRVF